MTTLKFGGFWESTGRISWNLGYSQAWGFLTRLTLDAHSCITHRRRHLSLGSCWCYRVINPCWWGCISCQLLFSQKICTTGFSRPKIKQRKFISFRNFCWNWTKCVKFQWFQRQITTGVCKLTKSVTKFHTFTLLLLQLWKKCVVFWRRKKLHSWQNLSLFCENAFTMLGYK